MCSLSRVTHLVVEMLKLVQNRQPQLLNYLWLQSSFVKFLFLRNMMLYLGSQATNAYLTHNTSELQYQRFCRDGAQYHGHSRHLDICWVKL